MEEEKDWETKYSEYQERRSIHEEKYKAKLENGQASGFDKFFHGVNSILNAFIEAGNKEMHRRR